MSCRRSTTWLVPVTADRAADTDNASSPDEDPDDTFVEAHMDLDEMDNQVRKPWLQDEVLFQQAPNDPSDAKQEPQFQACWGCFPTSTTAAMEPMEDFAISPVAKAPLEDAAKNAEALAFAVTKQASWGTSSDLQSPKPMENKQPSQDVAEVVPVEVPIARTNHRFPGSGTGSWTSLSAIPEGAVAVSNVFKCILAGRGAIGLAELTCSSEASQAYRPRVRRRSHRVEQDEGEQMYRRPSIRSQTTQSSSGELNLFCPISKGEEQRLACLIFEAVEEFSANLPQLPNEALTKEACVVLLHYPHGANSNEDRGPPDTNASSEECVKDLGRRIAEINFWKYTPLVFILSVTDDETASNSLCGKRFKMKDGQEVPLFRLRNLQDETKLVETFTAMADKVVAEQARIARQKSKEKSIDGAVQGCCTLM